MIDASILIVSHNRQKELDYTLSILERYVNYKKHEILIFLDGCTDNSEDLTSKFPLVKWFISLEQVGASKARYNLYSKALGTIIIGLDDDAHPLQADFIDRIIRQFEADKNIGVLALKEVRGIFKSDAKALEVVDLDAKNYYCNEFVGCGFAIKNEVYRQTNGFPVWMDIYGEESCLAIEVLALNFDILFVNNIAINHRVDNDLRLKEGNNYFRFGKQLRNTIFYFIIYYKQPIKPILKLIYHNFRKYALKDIKYCEVFFRQVIVSIWDLPKVKKYRNPVPNSVLIKKSKLRAPR